MIQPNELRKGNFVNVLSQDRGDTVPRIPIEKPLSILTIGALSVEGLWPGEKALQIEKWTEVKYQDIEPIPLTEEWLLKAGFKDGHKESIHAYFGSHIAHVELEATGGDWGHGVTTSIYTDVKYVHQLQNLYFAIYGEELNFNL